MPRDTRTQPAKKAVEAKANATKLPVAGNRKPATPQATRRSHHKGKGAAPRKPDPKPVRKPVRKAAEFLTLKQFEKAYPPESKPDPKPVPEAESPPEPPLRARLPGMRKLVTAFAAMSLNDVKVSIRMTTDVAKDPPEAKPPLSAKEEKEEKRISDTLARLELEQQQWLARGLPDSQPGPTSRHSGFSFQPQNSCFN